MKTKIPKNLIVKFIKDNFSTKETSTGELRINSIFDNDKKYHLYIEPDKEVFNDFKSGENGKIEKLISEFLNIPEQNILTYLIKEYGLDTIIQEKIEEEKDSVSLILPEGLKFFNEGKIGIIGKKAYNYLKKRKIEEEKIMKLGYIYNEESEYNNSIFIPFYENGEIVYFITRDFTGESYLRYKNPHGLDSKKFLYNIDNLGETIIICEGVFDALSIDNPQATCLLSADLGKDQAKKIFNIVSPKNIIFVPDNDETGERTLQNNIKMLYLYKPASLSIRVYIYKLPKGIKDLNELKVNVGKNIISIDECELYKKRIELKAGRRKFGV